MGIPEVVIYEIEYHIARNDNQYADNYRAYKKGDELGKKEYKKRQRKGCCGYADFSVTINKEKWYVGYNYGH